MEKGRAAVFVGPRHFEMTELPPVPVGPGGIRVKILAGGICGSDLHFWRGEIEPILTGKQGPVILGHEMAGVATGGGRPGGLHLFFPLPSLLQLLAR